MQAMHSRSPKPLRDRVAGGMPLLINHTKVFVAGYRRRFMESLLASEAHQSGSEAQQAHLQVGLEIYKVVSLSLRIKSEFLVML
jgi:hypothetical protein